jgi:hypothetical protein
MVTISFDHKTSVTPDTLIRVPGEADYVSILSSFAQLKGTSS